MTIQNITTIPISGQKQSLYNSQLKIIKSAFTSAKDRCQNPKYHHYQNYGGRGIEFRFTSFEEFFQEVGFRPSNKHSLDRINNNGHYEKGNVRWATKAEQQRNKRNSLLVLYEGKWFCAGEVARFLGVCRSVIQRRVQKGWCADCIVSLPKRGNTCEHRGTK